MKASTLVDIRGNILNNSRAMCFKILVSFKEVKLNPIVTNYNMLSGIVSEKDRQLYKTKKNKNDDNGVL